MAGARRAPMQGIKGVLCRAGLGYQTKSEKLEDPALPENRWQFVYRVAAVSRGTLP